ncbi:MAG: hypothetical protein RLZZ306_1906 [Bacteroidota bacterium]|jgi:hypothetical protein
MAKQKSIDLLEPILIETFNLERVFVNTPLLNEWITSKSEINEIDMLLVEEARAKLIENADSWNEEELKMQFISIIIFLARCNNPIRTYYDREISAEINEIFVCSKVDMMLSKGIGELIKTPYFFLHEYKREKKYSGDPVGQMLGGMLIGQAKNNNGNPIYGCYVQGRFWFFSVLIGNQYVISDAYDSVDIEELKQIISILRKMKLIIQETLMV